VIAVPRARIKALIASLTGLDPGQVVWAGEPSPAVWTIDGQGAYGLLTISSTAVNQHGWDDTNRIEGAGGSLTTSLRGAREVPISIRYESHGPLSDVLAEDILELVRTRIFSSTAQATMDAFRAAVSAVGDIIVPPRMVIDTRQISVAILDMTMRYSQFDDQSLPSDGCIKRVTGTGTLGGAADAGIVAFDSALASGAPNGALGSSVQRWTIVATGNGSPNGTITAQTQRWTVAAVGSSP